MKNILVYGDSLSWGIIPGTRKRLARDERWPGILEKMLSEHNYPAHVIEECLNGRRTMWDDPIRPGRNGVVFIEQYIESHSPLSLVIVFLGTNDFQSPKEVTAEQSAIGMRKIVNAIQSTQLEPGMPRPKILIVSPPLIEAPFGDISRKFIGAPARSSGLSAFYEAVADEFGCFFLDSAVITSASKVDGIHLDEAQHMQIAKAITSVVLDMFA